MVDRTMADSLSSQQYCFNLVIEILMVDRNSEGSDTETFDLFQSRNRDSYG